MAAAETFGQGASDISSGVREMDDAEREELAELLRRAADALESEDYDQKAAVMQAVHDHPRTNHAEKAEAAHHLAKAHAGRGDHETAAAWHEYARGLPGATSEHHEGAQQHAEHRARAETHEHPLHERSSETHLQAHLDHADQHLSSGNHDESIARHTALANHPQATPAQQAHALSQVAHAHAARGDHQAAAEWHQAAAAHPGASDAHRQAAQSHHENHGAGSRVHSGSSQDDLRRHIQRAEQDLDDADITVLLELLLAIIEHGSADGDTQAHAHHLKARVHERAGDHEKAAEHHRQAANHPSARSEHREHHDKHKEQNPQHHQANA